MTLWLPKRRFGKNSIGGAHEHLITHDWRTNTLLTFHTRRACREWIEDDMGYLRNRPDLKAAPHHWLMPIPVRVEIVEIKDDTTHRPAVRPLSQRRRP